MPRFAVLSPGWSKDFVMHAAHNKHHVVEVTSEGAAQGLCGKCQEEQGTGGEEG